MRGIARHFRHRSIYYSAMASRESTARGGIDRDLGVLTETLSPSFSGPLSCHSRFA